MKKKCSRELVQRLPETLGNLWAGIFIQQHKRSRAAETRRAAHGIELRGADAKFHDTIYP